MSKARISIRQFANEVGISHTRVRQLVKSGVLPQPDRHGLPYADSMEAWRDYSASRTTWKHHGRKHHRTVCNDLSDIMEQVEKGLEETTAMLAGMELPSLDIELESIDIQLDDIDIELVDLDIDWLRNIVQMH